MENQAVETMKCPPSLLTKEMLHQLEFANKSKYKVFSLTLLHIKVNFKNLLVYAYICLGLLSYDNVNSNK